MLNITERQDADVAILDLERHLIMGGGSVHLRDAIRNLIKEGKRKILLNFTGVKYIDSSGIGELISGLVAVNREDGHMKLLNLSEKAKEVMALSSLLSLFEIYDDEAEALNSY